MMDAGRINLISHFWPSEMQKRTFITPGYRVHPTDLLYRPQPP